MSFSVALETNKQTYLQIVMFNPQAFEANASSSDGKQALIDFDFFSIIDHHRYHHSCHRWHYQLNWPDRLILLTHHIFIIDIYPHRSRFTLMYFWKGSNMTFMCQIPFNSSPNCKTAKLRFGPEYFILAVRYTIW